MVDCHERSESLGISLVQSNPLRDKDVKLEVVSPFDGVMNGVHLPNSCPTSELAQS